jgi:hypothetical protein
MRFDEPDVRDAYRRGVHDLYESVAAGLGRRQARGIDVWLRELDEWHEGEPPPSPLG